MNATDLAGMKPTAGPVNTGRAGLIEPGATRDEWELQFADIFEQVNASTTVRRSTW